MPDENSSTGMPIPVRREFLPWEAALDDYLCLTIQSRAAELEAEFKKRLSEFWTGMLRERPEDFEKVYAESSSFDRNGEQLERRYLVESEAMSALTDSLAAAGFSHAPVDPEDLYSKFEAAPPDWFWIEH